MFIYFSIILDSVYFSVFFNSILDWLFTILCCTVSWKGVFEFEKDLLISSIIRICSFGGILDWLVVISYLNHWIRVNKNKKTKIIYLTKFFIWFFDKIFASSLKIWICNMFLQKWIWLTKKDWNFLEWFWI